LELKISIEEKKGVNHIEKYVENKLHKNKKFIKKLKKSPLDFEPS
jgi:hypothetical protein